MMRHLPLNFETHERTALQKHRGPLMEDATKFWERVQSPSFVAYVDLRSEHVSASGGSKRWQFGIICRMQWSDFEV